MKLVITDSGAPSSDTPVIDVRPGSQMSLDLSGTLGPSLTGQTLTHAVVTIQDVQLVNASAHSTALMTGSFTADVLPLQCALRRIVDRVSVPAGRFSEVRFRLADAWVESVDASNATHVHELEIAGLDPDGFVTAAVPPGGLVVQGTTSVVLNFALDESLSVPDSGAWVLSPRSWLADETTLSSVAVGYDATSTTSAHEFSKGFEAMLLDSNLRPLCASRLQAVSSGMFGATFASVGAFEGPFVVTLLPPPGTTLESSVAVSIDVQPSVAAYASVQVTGIDQVSSSSFAVVTAGQCTVVRRGRQGEVIGRTTEPVGDIDHVAPHVHHVEPVAPRH